MIEKYNLELNYFNDENEKKKLTKLLLETIEKYFLLNKK